MGINTGDLFRHYRNGVIYEVVNNDMAIQQNDVWVPAIGYKIYEDNNNKTVYVRSLQEFNKKFIKIEEVENDS